MVVSEYRTAAQDQEAQDAMLRENRHLVAGGCHGHVIKTPSELLEEKEEGLPPMNSSQLRSEVFWGLLGYAFADGPHPVEVLARFYAAVRGAQWGRLHKVPEEYFRVLVDDAVGVDRALVYERGYALIAGEDRAEQYQKKVEHQLERNREKIARSRLFRSGCFPLASLLMAESEDGVQAGVYFAGLFDFVMKHGTDALSTLRMLYVVVKALKEELIGGMSLHSLAALSCDKGRQTTSARVLRDYNRFVEGDSGVIVKAPYQKSEKTVQKYREAQKGNKNRIKGRRRRKLG